MKQLQYVQCTRTALVNYNIMANNSTDIIFDDNFYLGVWAEIILQYMRVRVSKFEYVVMTHRVDVNTLLKHLCNIIDLDLFVK